MSCEVVQSECLRLGSRVPVTLDFSALAARQWRAAAIFAAETRIRGRNAGFEFEASGGQTGDREPKWPKVLGGTVTDGSITWTARAISAASLRKTIATVTWEADASITITGEQVTAAEQTATAYLEPTTAGTYLVTVWVTFNDNPAHREGFAIELEVK